MTQVMYRRHDGTVGFYGEAAGQKLLASDGWKDLNAKSLPYTSQTSGSLDNVSTALDHLLKRLAELSSAVGDVTAMAGRITSENDAITRSVMASVQGLEEKVLRSTETIARSTHAPLGINRVSNPALTIEPVGQTIRLDLAAPGSFDDSASRLGASSVQGALARLATVTAGLTNDGYRLFNEVVGVSHRITELESRLMTLEQAQSGAIEARIAALVEQRSTVAPKPAPIEKPNRVRKPKAKKTPASQPVTI